MSSTTKIDCIQLYGFKSIIRIEISNLVVMCVCLLNGINF